MHFLLLRNTASKKKKKYCPYFTRARQVITVLYLLTAFWSHQVPCVALGARKSKMTSFILFPLISFSSHATQACTTFKFPLSKAMQPFLPSHLPRSVPHPLNITASSTSNRHEVYLLYRHHLWNTARACGSTEISHLEVQRPTGSLTWTQTKVWSCASTWWQPINSS